MYTIKDKKEALKLRSKGKSYGEIVKILNLKSKGSLSSWFKNIKLSPKSKKRLADKIDLARKRGLFAFNENRTKKIINEHKKILTESKFAIKKFSKNDILLIGTALYWAEGSLREYPNRYSRISFSNSDPRMIKFFLQYLREILEVPENQIRAGIQIHKNIKERVAKNFWSKITGLSQEKFCTFNQVSRSSKLKRPKNFLPYGTISIRVNDRRIFYRIKGCIQGIANQ